MQITPAFMVGDKSFATKKEAEDYIRIPLITNALKVVTGGNADLTKWLLENQQDVTETYEVNKIQRVTKLERKALSKALDAVKEAKIPGAAFIVDNEQAILDSFKWPAVNRIKPEEHAANLTKAFMELTEGNEKLSQWLIENKDQLLAAFASGVEKREISAKAVDGLAAYRAAKEAGPEALEAYQKGKAERKAAEEAAKAAKNAGV